MKQTYSKIGSFSATITSIGEPVNGVNAVTSEPFTYVPIIAKHSDPTKDPIKQCIFVEKDYNKIESIIVGARINVITSKGDIDKKINIKTFIGSEFMSVRDMIALAGGNAEDIEAGATQAKASAQKSAAQRIADRAAARAAALDPTK
jgi:hypothetical protein